MKFNKPKIEVTELTDDLEHVKQDFEKTKHDAEVTTLSQQDEPEELIAVFINKIADVANVWVNKQAETEKYSIDKQHEIEMKRITVADKSNKYDFIIKATTIFLIVVGFIILKFTEKLDNAASIFLTAVLFTVIGKDFGNTFSNFYNSFTKGEHKKT